MLVVIIVVSPRSPSSPQGWAWCSGTGMFLRGCLKQRRREAKGRHGGGYPRYQDCQERRERLPLAPCAMEPPGPLSGVSPTRPELSPRCPPARSPCCPPLLHRPVSPLCRCQGRLVPRHRRGEGDAPSADGRGRTLGGGPLPHSCCLPPTPALAPSSRPSRLPHVWFPLATRQPGPPLPLTLPGPATYDLRAAGLSHPPRGCRTPLFPPCLRFPIQSIPERPGGSRSVTRLVHTEGETGTLRSWGCEQL